MLHTTIAAIATAPGRGGIGIIRISGPKVGEIAQTILGFAPKPRYAHPANFLDLNREVIDQGIALYFSAPNSFTGEDVLELQGHGGPVVLDRILQTILSLGAVPARAGEFSERAFLNNKVNLTQAEAIADLIDAGSEQAARAALRSLQGEFSKQIDILIEELIRLRIYVEAAIDFPEEEIDFISEGNIENQLKELLLQLQAIQAQAKQGSLLQEGMKLVIAGQPNAGKSSLLNALSGRDLAIVTDIPGTTRDILQDQIQIDGLPLHIIDTAGLRESTDPIEQEGIRRALLEIENADRVLLITDATLKIPEDLYKLLKAKNKNLTIVRNKIDLLKTTAEIKQEGEEWILSLSAKTNDGLSLLRDHLKFCMGFQENMEGNFSARRRHLDALCRAEQFLLNGLKQLSEHKAGELLAEDLRQTQQVLGEITGAFSSDELLGQIFSSFCIGK